MDRMPNIVAQRGNRQNQNDLGATTLDTDSWSFGVYMYFFTKESASCPYCGSPNHSIPVVYTSDIMGKEAPKDLPPNFVRCTRLIDPYSHYCRDCARHHGRLPDIVHTMLCGKMDHCD